MPNPDRSSGHDRKVRIILRAALTLSLIAAFALPALGVASTPAQRDHNTLRFFVTHPKQARSVAGQKALLAIMLRMDARLRSLQAIRSAQPAHLALWRCIEKGESGGDGVHPGSERASNGSHFNVLQMTNPWAGINPIGLSYAVIEQAAEKQYAASGYSRAWLNGQWGQTVGPCWGLA